MNYIFYNKLINKSAIRIVEDNIKNRHIEFSENGFFGYYNINSISYCIDDICSQIQLKLSYTFYCYEENKLWLFNNNDTLIASSEVVTYKNYKMIEDELLGFGKGLSKYMGLKFIVLDIGASQKYNAPKIRCNKCGGLILTKPRDENILSKYQLDKELFKVTKKDYNYLSSSQLGQINNRISNWIARYCVKIREDFYCEDCIESFWVDYKKDINAYINAELVRFYNKNKNND